MWKRIALLASAAIAAVALAVVPVSGAQAVVPVYQVAQSVSLPSSGDVVTGVAVDPARGLVYVASRFSNAVYVYDEATLTLQNTIPVPNEPYNITVGATGAVYVSQYTGNNLPGTVSAIDPATDTIVATLPTGNSPVGVTVSRDGSRLFVANLSSSFLSVYSLASPLSPVADANISLPGGSETITGSADGAVLYIATDSNRVYVVDATTGTLATTWTGFSAVHQVVLATGGTQAFVSQQLGAQMPIFSIATNTQSGTIPLANTYYQSTDTTLGAGFVTQPFTNGGMVDVLDAATGAIDQSLPVAAAFYVATDSTTHNTFVTSGTTATLTKIVPSPLTITTNPASQSVTEGSVATFTAAASGPQPVTVQWQSSTDGGTTWAYIVGATNTSFTTPSTTLSDDGTQYRAVFTDALTQTATTTAATLAVTVIPVAITTDPVDQTVSDGTTATFSAAASGTAPITVQWQISTDGGTTWTNVSGATNPSVNVTATSADNGAQYRAVFTGPGAGNTATSTAATLTVTLAVVNPNPPGEIPAAGGSLANTGSELSNALLPGILAVASCLGGAGLLLRRRMSR